MGNELKREIGNKAEDLACTFLSDLGWEILHRNFYAGRAEVDIIAKDGDVIVFLEVKMRSGTKFGNPIEFINEAKVERIFSAAEQWTQQQNAFDSPLRFDVIGILKNGKGFEITHIKDAYR